MGKIRTKSGWLGDEVGTWVSYKDYQELEARINKACDQLERLRDEPESEIPIPDHLPQIDNILFDLEGGAEGFSLELDKS